jgi:hypothetical protein
MISTRPARLDTKHLITVAASLSAQCDVQKPVAHASQSYEDSYKDQTDQSKYPL